MFVVRIVGLFLIIGCLEKSLKIRLNRQEGEITPQLFEPAVHHASKLYFCGACEHESVVNVLTERPNGQEYRKSAFLK